MRTKRDPLRDYLYRKLIHSIDGDHIDLDEFISQWFSTDGNALYFLFSRNLSVTNIQFAELTALLRMHMRRRDRGILTCPLFVSLDEYERRLRDLLQSFLPAPDPRELAGTLVSLYGGLINQMVVLEPLFGSCAVFLPPHIEIDLEAVCGLSGYVHSCGRLLYLLQAERSSPEALLEALRSHLSAPTGPTVAGPPAVRFVLYGREDFSGDDAQRGVDLKRGIEDVQLLIDKYYVGDSRLTELPTLLEAELGGRLRFVNRWEKGRGNKDLLAAGSVDSKRSVFLVSERASGSEPWLPGAERYYVCYEQTVINESPFQVFDENKPAWWSPTTMPQSLAAAMINISRPWWRPGHGKIRIADPFAGSGTTLLESLKYGNVTCLASDQEPITPQLARDNLAVFAMTEKELLALADTLAKGTLLSGAIAGRLHGKGRVHGGAAVIEMLSVACRGDLHEASISGELVKKIRKLRFEDRLLFYVGLRATVRHATGLIRGAEEWDQAFHAEALSLVKQIRILAEMRRRGGDGNDAKGMLSTYRGEYSVAVSIRRDQLAKSAERFMKVDPIRVRPAKSIHGASFDVVITDPPYGFNTEENPRALAGLYRSFLKDVTACLQRGGQLVLCLPERSYTGRRTRSFTRSRMVTAAIEAACDELGCELEQVSQVGAEDWDLFRPPFYWDAEKTLRRSILHFRFRGARRKREWRSA